MRTKLSISKQYGPNLNYLYWLEFNLTSLDTKFRTKIQRFQYLSNSNYMDQIDNSSANVKIVQQIITYI